MSPDVEDILRSASLTDPIAREILTVGASDSEVVEALIKDRARILQDAIERESRRSPRIILGEFLCDCDLNYRAWNPNTGRCETCGSRYQK